jgi:hypothetical protein
MQNAIRIRSMLFVLQIKSAQNCTYVGQKRDAEARSNLRNESFYTPSTRCCRSHRRNTVSRVRCKHGAGKLNVRDTRAGMSRW